MADEWGIFSDEGLIEAGFYSEHAAKTFMLTNPDYEDDDSLSVERICADHNEQPARACELCDSEEDTDDDDAGESDDD